MTLQIILDFHKFANQYDVALATLTWTIWMNVESGIQEHSYCKAGQLKGRKFYEIFTVYDRFDYFIDLFDVWNIGFFYFQAECWHLKLISGQLMFETQFSWPMAPLIADHPYSVTFHDGFPIYSLLSGIVLRPSIFVCALICHDGVAIFLVYTNTYVSGCFIFLWSDKKKHSEFFYSVSEILGSHT